MLRKFHASALLNDGMSKDDVNSMQGKSKTKTDESYFFDDPDKLKQKYIQHLSAVTINSEVNSLDAKSPEFVKLEEENKKKDDVISKYEDFVDNIDDCINKKIQDTIKKSSAFVSDDEFEELIFVINVVFMFLINFLLFSLNA